MAKFTLLKDAGRGGDDVIWTPKWHRVLSRMQYQSIDICVLTYSDCFCISNKTEGEHSVTGHSLTIKSEWIPDPYLHLSTDPEFIYHYIVKALKGQYYPESLRPQEDTMANGNQKRKREIARKSIKAGKGNPFHKVKTNIGDPKGK